MSTPLPNRLRTVLFHALRAAFRLTPLSQATRDKLRQRFLDTRGHWVPEGPKGKAPGSELPRRPYVRSDERAIGYVPYQKGELPDPLPATLVAFYLPQFHTIPENDEWWGKGFTEWRNVTRALPQFEGHYQPKLPGDLGFYDLRNVEVMHEQARLAREYGISAFCFYFYWFGGKTLLETPLRNWLNDKTIDLKFCLCWANEKWTRTWDGRGDEILIDQQHSPEDDIAFIKYVAEYMQDSRYLRVEGKPILIVYRPGIFADAKQTAQRWREYCRQSDLGEIHLVYVQSFEKPRPEDIGFDAGIEFPPNSNSSPPITSDVTLINQSYAGTVVDWSAMANDFMNRVQPDYRLYRGVNVGWDNESRKPGKGRTFVRASQGLYRNWLATCIENSPHGASTAPIVFINAWNEWAEGATLEPDLRLGYALLKSTRDVLTKPKSPIEKFQQRSCVILHAWHLEILEEILDLLCPQKFYSRLLITTTEQKKDFIEHALRLRNMQGEIVIVENRGRDILPFLRVSNALLSEGVDLILKLHTKKSPHIENGEQWRRELLFELATPEAVNTIIKGFAKDPRLGMVTADGHRQSTNQFLGANTRRMHELCTSLGIPVATEQYYFPAGSMFWARLSALRPILERAITASDFEAEASQVDGTTAHAIERLFGATVHVAGYRFSTPSEITQTAPCRTGQAYPYAGSQV